MPRYGYLRAYLIPLLVIFQTRLGGGYHFLLPVFVFGVIPLLDWIVGENLTNPTKTESPVLHQDKFFLFLLFAYVPVQFLMVIGGAYYVTHHPLSWLEYIGFTLSVGIATGAIGITVAHELGHGARRLNQWSAQLLLMSVYYMHFFIEHNQGHHSKVATPEDPASARVGESFYAFLPRTVIGSIFSAWQIEKQRLQKMGLTAFSVKNRMLWYGGLPLLFALGLTGLFGAGAFLFFILQSAIAFTLLELINYIEHYGLQRKEIAPGRYEPVTPQHSWNSSAHLTNCFLFNLQRHSDHHAHARPYQVLRHYEESPQLPTGYAAMVPLALIPPFWKKIMDPKVQQLYSP